MAVSRVGVVVVALLMAACLVNHRLEAAPVQWSANGHYYELIEGPLSGWDEAVWEQARDAAAARSYLGQSGHLATVTSQGENDFITQMLLPLEAGTHYWLGGYQPEGSSEPAGGWQWVTGETWSYTNWHVGEPNDKGGIEDYLDMRGQEGDWNDYEASLEHVSHVSIGYIVEYAPEPATISLLGIGLLGLTRLRGGRRR